MNGKRKWFFGGGIIALTSAMCWFGKVDQDVFQNVLIFVGNGFFLANVGEHFTGRRADG